MGDLNSVGIGAAAVGLMLTACVSHPGAQPELQPTAVTTAAYNGRAYVAQVERVILDSVLLDSWDQACPQPDWVCAIDTMTSSRPRDLEVTLKADWQRSFGEWTGPPAGIGCVKWGGQIRNNIENFVRGSDVETPRWIAVREPNGRNC